MIGHLWRGMGPFRLARYGLVQGALSLFGAFIAFRVYGGELGEMLGEEPGWARLLGILLLLFAVYGAVRLVIGVVDLVARRTVSGRVVDVRERRTGDRLPGILQGFVDQYDEPNAKTPWFVPRIRHWNEVTLSSSSGTHRWSVSRRHMRDLAEGMEAELVVGPLLGHVSSVRPG